MAFVLVFSGALVADANEVEQVVGAQLAPSESKIENVTIRVDISDQEMVVLLNGVERHRWPVSTGEQVRWTPKGKYVPYWL